MHTWRVPDGKKGQFAASLLFHPDFAVTAEKVSFTVERIRAGIEEPPAPRTDVDDDTGRGAVRARRL